MSSTTALILIDDREKKPLPFPTYLPIWDPRSPPGSPRKITVRIIEEKRTLTTGDYLLGSAPNACGIERKGSLDELRANLATKTGRRRFLDCMKRLTDTFQNPVLFLEGTPLELARTVRGPHTDAEVTRDLLTATLSSYPKVSLLLLPCGTIPQRKAAAEWVASLLIFGGLFGPPKENLDAGDPDH